METIAGSAAVSNVSAREGQTMITRALHEKTSQAKRFVAAFVLFAIATVGLVSRAEATAVFVGETAFAFSVLTRDDGLIVSNPTTSLIQLPRTSGNATAFLDSDVDADAAAQVLFATHTAFGIADLPGRSSVLADGQASFDLFNDSPEPLELEFLVQLFFVLATSVDAPLPYEMAKADAHFLLSLDDEPIFDLDVWVSGDDEIADSLGGVSSFSLDPGETKTANLALRLFGRATAIPEPSTLLLLGLGFLGLALFVRRPLRRA